MSFLTGPSRRPDAAATVATYRHLLSPQAMTVFNPLRTIAHCDIDAAYAQFEQVRLGLADDLPLICAQWQSIIAVNYPARKFGIKRFNTIDEARKLCPHLLVQHVATYRNGEAEAGYWGEVDPMTHKVSLDPYRRESLKILALFKEMAPRGEIQKASIDEAFLDLTPMMIERLLIAHPYLATIPEDAPEGLDSPLPRAPPIDWTNAGNVFAVEGVDSASQEETRSDDGGDEEHREKVRDGASWEDWALCTGAEIMAELREAVWTRMHYTCSAGIAHNKAMAKLCSAWKKPNNQTVLRMSATPAFLRNMDFTDIRFLGGKLGNAIATEYGAKTVGDMLSVSLEELQRRFGEESIWVYNILRGIDHTEVKERVASKSMLASKNIKPSVRSPEQGHHWLSVLAGELHVRLRDAREISPGLWPKTLVLSHRTGIEPSRSRQTPFPFTRHLSTEYIVRYARKLWDEATQPMNKGNMKLNNIALSFTGLERLEEGQRGIEGFFAAGSTKPEVVSPDGKRSRSHSPAVGATEINPSPKKPRLPTLHTGKRKTALESFLARKGEPSTPTPVPNIPLAPIDVLDDDVEVDSKTAITESDGLVDVGTENRVCPKCGKLLTPFDDADGASRASSVKEQRQEHEDYHFALDLQDGDRGGGGGDQPKPNAKVKKKVPKKAEGIKAFFTAKAAKHGQSSEE